MYRGYWATIKLHICDLERTWHLFRKLLGRNVEVNTILNRFWGKNRHHERSRTTFYSFLSICSLFIRSIFLPFFDRNFFRTYSTFFFHWPKNEDVSIFFSQKFVFHLWKNNSLFVVHFDRSFFISIDLFAFIFWLFFCDRRTDSVRDVWLRMVGFLLRN